MVPTYPLGQNDRDFHPDITTFGSYPDYTEPELQGSYGNQDAHCYEQSIYSEDLERKFSGSRDEEIRNDTRYDLELDHQPNSSTPAWGTENVERSIQNYGGRSTFWNPDATSSHRHMNTTTERPAFPRSFDHPPGLYSIEQPLPLQTQYSKPPTYSSHVGRGTPVAVQGPSPCNDHPESRSKNAHGVRLRPVSELPDMFRSMFKFGVFNAVQSTCFDAILKTDKNMLVSAPTGSGKTTIFELAIIHMLSQSQTKDCKCVYMAPTKALCTEKYQEWSTKFTPLGFKCCELTGDTVQFGKSAWGDAHSASIIITTAEKWDSLTRSWATHGEILSQIQLFMVDEVHILNESRGSTLEVVISRMKQRGTRVRFVMVSATVPNMDDVAKWVGGSKKGSEQGAEVFQFGDEFRPCKLARFVYGMYRPKNQNDWGFEKSLTSRVFDAIQRHSEGKPVLVFVATRKGTLSTAEALLQQFKDASSKHNTPPWPQSSQYLHAFSDRKLAELAEAGIGIHHAGLDLVDRRATEDLFTKKILRVIVATSTLAVGVNLPAFMVVIKGVKSFHDGIMQEYSDLNIIQMIGRAGRPQFDKEGVAVILCESELEAKYAALTSGKTCLESSLHENLAEHINSEIGLGTITSVNSARAWLESTFLYQRIKKNPENYPIGEDVGRSWGDKVDEIITNSIRRLEATQLVTHTKEGPHKGELLTTEFGDIMSRFYVRQSTMAMILTSAQKPNLREMLELIASSEDLVSKLRTSEKSLLAKLGQHYDIRFTVKKVEKPGDKAFILLQAVLGGIPLHSPEYRSSDSQLSLEALTMTKHAIRIAKVVVEVGIARKFGAQVKHGLELVRCLEAKAWEDRHVVLKQVENVGEKAIRVLAENGIATFETLRKQNPLRLDSLMNRNPPFGYNIIASVKEMPLYRIQANQNKIWSSNDSVEVDIDIHCSAIIEPKSTKATKKAGRRLGMTAILTLTSDLEFIDFRRISTKSLESTKSFSVIARLTKPSQSVIIQVSSETIAGITVTEALKPQLDMNLYPTVNTKPKSTEALELDGLEACSELWKTDDIDENGEFIDNEEAIFCDLTKSQAKSKHIESSSGTVKVSQEKLPNGHYACLHLCKNKTTCRHICCKEGLVKPPKPSKSRVVPLAPQSSQHQLEELYTRPTPKKLSKHPDKRVKQLESLHDRTSVTENLKISTNKRIKLGTQSSSSSRSSKTKASRPDFNIVISDIPTSGLSQTYEELDDDDDLPDLREALGNRKYNFALKADLGKVANPVNHPDGRLGVTPKVDQRPTREIRSQKRDSALFITDYTPSKKRKVILESPTRFHDAQPTYKIQAPAKLPPQESISDTEEPVKSSRLFFSSPPGDDTIIIGDSDQFNNEDFSLTDVDIMITPSTTERDIIPPSSDMTPSQTNDTCSEYATSDGVQDWDDWLEDLMVDIEIIKG